MGNGQIQSFVPASKMIAPFAINKIRGNEYAYGFSGVLARWKAGLGQDTVTNGASVTTWRDLIKGNFFTAVSAPTYTASDANFNNQPTLKFSTTRNMTLASPLGIPKNFTLFVCYKIIGLSTSTNDFLVTSVGIPFVVAAQTETAGQRGERIIDATPNRVLSTNNDTSAHISIFTRTDVRRDGVSVLFSAALDSTIASATQIGSSTAARGLNSDIAEIILFDSQLSSAQQDQLRDNARPTYGL